MNVIKLLAELDANFDLDGFYCVTLWPSLNEISLQGHFTASNVKIAETMGIELIYKDGFIKGTSENGNVKIALSSQ
jgi:hypothetical protein